MKVFCKLLIVSPTHTLFFFFFKKIKFISHTRNQSGADWWVIWGSGFFPSCNKMPLLMEKALSSIFVCKVNLCKCVRPSHFFTWFLKKILWPSGEVFTQMSAIMFTIAMTFLELFVCTGTLFSLHLSKLLLFCPVTKEKGDEMVSCDSSTTQWSQRTKLYLWNKSNHKGKKKSIYFPKLFNSFRKQMHPLEKKNLGLPWQSSS